MTKKKRGFMFFICSLVPGVAEMYMGFMKMGVSLLSIFLVTIGVANSIQSDLLGLISVVLWFYGFFHAHNLSGMDDETFKTVRDDYLFHMSDFEKGRNLTGFYRKVIAFVLIFLGVSLLWKGIVCQFILQYCNLPSEINDMIYGINDMIPKIVVAIAIIILGIHMIKGKKSELEQEEEFCTWREADTEVAKNVEKKKEEV